MTTSRLDSAVGALLASSIVDTHDTLAFRCRTERVRRPRGKEAQVWMKPQ